MMSLFFAPKTPTVARIFIAVGLLAALVRGARVQAKQPQPLDEKAVTARALELSPQARVARAVDELADARQRTAGRLANPRITWERETVESGPEADQDILAASFSIDVARPLTTRSLVASRGAWSRSQAARAQVGGVLDALLVYYAAAVAQARVEVLEAALVNLDEAARVVERREAAGGVSGYESSRLEIAEEMARSHLVMARVESESETARLASLLQLDSTAVRVDARLALATRERAAHWLAQGPSQREAVVQAKASQNHALKAQDRAGWAWLPTLELGAGMKHVTEFGGGFGYVLGVSLSLPVFDHGQAFRAQADAQRELATARLAALNQEIDAEAQAAFLTFARSQAELERFDAETKDRVQVLLRAAQSGYREGERTIVELLDAQRAQIGVAQRRLELLLVAKQAEARLRTVLGEF